MDQSRIMVYGIRLIRAPIYSFRKPDHQRTSNGRELERAGVEVARADRCRVASLRTDASCLERFCVWSRMCAEDVGHDLSWSGTRLFWNASWL
ncbi:hypothetical protein F2Q70_00027214 [Brassica cretica]|uniref:Uncharacterized protein n=1 Tax=Brassica cretica TaxID=69181 RepID=A0A8S9L3N1_BRACR|nr:hypothetical protein F2Q70_00027214 [Brassica cretica]